MQDAGAAQLVYRWLSLFQQDLFDSLIFACLSQMFQRVQRMYMLRWWCCDEKTCANAMMRGEMCERKMEERKRKGVERTNERAKIAVKNFVYWKAQSSTMAMFAGAPSSVPSSEPAAVLSDGHVSAHCSSVSLSDRRSGSE